MKRTFVWIAAVSMVAIVAIAVFWKQSIPPQLPYQQVPEPAPVQAQNGVPAIQYPLPDPGDSGKLLPELDASDTEFLAALVDLQRKLGSLVYPERIVRNIVVTIDNLPREAVSSRMRPVKPVPGAFRTLTEEKQLVIAPANAERYREYLRVLESVEPERLVEIYLQFYPLFQKAYQELGYPKGYFNDRLIAVIDHLIAAPELDDKAALVQPRVLYEFAEPELQQASAGHKIMMRMGAINAKRVKTYLEKIRARVVDASERVRSPS